jgi:hypothetical protein
MSPVPRDLAQLVVPALTWRAPGGFAHEQERITEYLAMGVGGFLLIGGEPDVVRTLAKRLQRESRHPLLIAADLERVAGQQFIGATGLPPLAAIASLDDLEALRRAARTSAGSSLLSGCGRVGAGRGETSTLAAKALWRAEESGFSSDVQRWMCVGSISKPCIESCMSAMRISRATAASGWVALTELAWQ